MQGDEAVKVEEDGEEKEEELTEMLVEVPPACASLPRHGIRASELERDLPWQRVFDPDLLLSRKHCKDGHKVPEKLFPDAQSRCESGRHAGGGGLCELLCASDSCAACDLGLHSRVDSCVMSAWYTTFWPSTFMQVAATGCCVWPWD